MAALEAFWLTNGDPWGPAPPIIPATPGNVVGYLYVQTPDFTPEALKAGRCRCRNGMASTDCPMHCHLVIIRRHAEDELLVLALV